MWQFFVNDIISIKRHNFNFSYYLSDISLPVATNLSDLGVTVDTALSFILHISTIAAVAIARCAFYLKTFLSYDSKTMSKFFVAYVRTIVYLNIAAPFGYLNPPFISALGASLKSILNDTAEP